MLYPALEEKLLKARLALDGATSESIIELCKQYLALLDEYRAELYKLPDTLELNSRTRSSSSREDIDETRKEVRTAIEHTTQERNRAEALILSFTAVSGYEATATLNRLKYNGHDDWELRAGGVRWGDNTNKRMTVQEAVEVVSLLRREEYIAIKEARNTFFNREGNPNRRSE
ncbi:MAG TPA: hypothetical protein VF779_13260 [Pyrinomonadaceae bacterium]